MIARLPTSEIVMIGSMSTAPSGDARMAAVESGMSNRLAAAAAAERERLERETARIESRAAEAAENLQRLVDERNRARERLALLARLAPVSVGLTGTDAEHAAEEEAAVEPSAEPPNGYLRGARIRTVAVHLLAASHAADRPIHYGEWFEMLARAGFGVSGKDPVAAFLTQITRSPVIQKADGPGLYRLDLMAPRELQRRLRELQEELLRLHDGQQTLESIASVRERRSELTGELARTERALEEAVASIGLDPLA